MERDEPAACRVIKVSMTARLPQKRRCTCFMALRGLHKALLFEGVKREEASCI